MKANNILATIYTDVFVPLHGRHQGDNAVVARLAAAGRPQDTAVGFRLEQLTWAVAGLVGSVGLMLLLAVAQIGVVPVMLCAVGSNPGSTFCRSIKPSSSSRQALCRRGLPALLLTTAMPTMPRSPCPYFSGAEYPRHSSSRLWHTIFEPVLAISADIDGDHYCVGHSPDAGVLCTGFSDRRRTVR